MYAVSNKRRLARRDVYLRTDATPGQSSPLERLHRRWLRNTYEGGRELGAS